MGECSSSAEKELEQKIAVGEVRQELGEAKWMAK
jgi:hypothetical protein